tara:strand:+ start:119 stop:358 length:240 start_codon:yes stop_codon:yes gene_type:complete
MGNTNHIALLSLARGINKDKITSHHAFESNSNFFELTNNRITKSIGNIVADAAPELEIDPTIASKLVPIKRIFIIDSII